MEDESRPNPRRSTRRRHHRRYYGLSDEQQKRVFEQQRAAVVAMFDAMEEYFCAELDAKLEALDEATKVEEPGEIDAEFSEAE